MILRATTEANRRPIGGHFCMHVALQTEVTFYFCQPMFRGFLALSKLPLGARESQKLRNKQQKDDTVVTLAFKGASYLQRKSHWPGMAYLSQGFAWLPLGCSWVASGLLLS